MPGTSLADWLRSASDDALTAVLRARADLATPPPADSTVLATRAGGAGSVARACEDLDTFTLAVAEALLLLDADTEPTTESALSKLVGADVTAALRLLCERALAWGTSDELHVVPTLRDVLGPFPASLGASDPTMADGDLTAKLDEVTEPERALLNTLAEGPPIGQTRDADTHVPLAGAETPVQRLLARGLLLRREQQTVELPRELAVALRGGRVFDPRTLSGPQLATTTHDASTVDDTAAGEASEFLRQMESLLAAWSAQPPAVLKSGGLGVRELRKLARELEIDESRAIVLVELALGAELIADTATTTTPEWVPTTLTDTWLASTPAQRWITLAQAWLELPRLPGLVGHRDSKDKPISPLAAQLHRPLAPTGRRRVLDALGELTEGTGVTTVDTLVGVLAWRAPRRGGRLRDDVVRWTMAEGATLGLVARGALTTPARALLAGDRHGAVETMAAALPQPVDHVLVQADLTVVAPGPLEPELAREVTAVADVESAGHATVYRVTETSVRRALDTGRTADELHELFRNHSRTPVPQSLSYLIDDVARRHGRLRGGAAASFLRCDDEVLLAEVLASTAVGELDLRKIAPTVLISPVPLAELMEGLRAAGFTPAAEGPDGRIVDLRPSGRRTPARGTSTGTSTSTAPRSGPVRQSETERGSIAPERIASIVSQVRAGDRAAAARPSGATVTASGGNGADTSATLGLLAQATRQQRQVWIGFVDSRGTASQRIVHPVRVGSGMLEGAQDERYPLHRITSAALVEE